MVHFRFGSARFGCPGGEEQAGSAGRGRELRRRTGNSGGWVGEDGCTVVVEVRNFFKVRWGRLDEKFVLANEAIASFARTRNSHVLA